VIKPRHHSSITVKKPDQARPEPRSEPPRPEQAPKVVVDDLPDNIGEPVKEVTEEGLKEIKIEAEDTETDTTLDPDLEIMFKNSGKPKPKPKPEEKKDDPDVRSFEYVGGSVDDSEGTISVKLLDEDDEMESRLSRLRKNKNDIPGK
jgi:hypothetical protein